MWRIFCIIGAIIVIGIVGAFGSAYSLASDITITADVAGTCGNEIIESGEQCDGTNLGGNSCQSLGFDGGTLSCSASCTFDTSVCTVQSPSGGGGGGGGSSGPVVATAGVSFSGIAYPQRTVTLLRDANVAATTIAGGDAKFSTALTNLQAGNYIFSLYSEDKFGNRSSMLTFPVSVTEGTTTKITGAFITPSIRTDKSEVRRGDPISILGQTAPKADVVIAVQSEEELFGRTVADDDGFYLLNFDTTPLESGNHTARSRASIDNQLISSLSPSVGFVVGTQNVFRSDSAGDFIGDLNGDGRINLVDFSILAFWYQRANPPVHIDLNGDGRVDLIDFSIMMFHWTG